MTEDLLGYNEMVETAMRSVVRQALDKAGNEGLPGEHHFYITFRTDHPETKIPARLKERYQEEMTIVLQHQFWNLTTSEVGFQVDLSFNHKMETLHIPYDSLITFADPSVNFGLQFHVDIDEDDWEREDAEVAAELDDGEYATNIKEISPEESTSEPREVKEDSGDNVVTLDSFRKDKK